MLEHHISAAEQASAQRELLTLRDLLRWAVSYLNHDTLSFGHGSDNAWDEAVYLLLHSLNLPLDQLEPFLDARLLASERERYIALITRRVNEQCPAAYLTGQAWLQGHSFRVSPATIVPRSPIAELLEEQLQPWISDPAQVQHALDMCTGSGCLAILCALAFPEARVDAVDLSSEALEVARLNVSDYGLEDRLSLHHSNLFDDLPAQRYDLIICNPPYVNQHSMDNLPKEYLHEPNMALAGGDDGMDLVRRILQAAPDFLQPEGILVLEIGHEYEHFCAAFPELEPVWLSTENSTDQILLLQREQLVS